MKCMRKAAGAVCLLVVLFYLFPAIKSEAAEVTDKSTGSTVSSMQPYVVKKGTEKEQNTYKTYEIEVSPADEENIVIPLLLKGKGTLNVVSELKEDNSDLYLYDGIYTDKKCTKPVSKIFYGDSYSIPKAGTYYYKCNVSVNSYSETDYEGQTAAVLFQCNFYDGSDKVLKNKEWACSGTGGQQKPIYYKVQAPSNGLLTVYTQGRRNCKIILCNGNKKVLSEETYTAAEVGKVCFGVNKGTYYLKVTSEADFYRIQSIFKAVNEKSGNSRNNAVTLKVGAAAKSGIVSINDKGGKEDWYKFTNNRNSKVAVLFKGSVSSGKIRLTFMDANKRSFGDQILFSELDKDMSFYPYVTTSYTSNNGTLPKGTYYIRIRKDTSKTSGYYTIGIK